MDTECSDRCPFRKRSQQKQLWIDQFCLAWMGSARTDMFARTVKSSVMGIFECEGRDSNASGNWKYIHADIHPVADLGIVAPWGSTGVDSVRSALRPRPVGSGGQFPDLQWHWTQIGSALCSLSWGSPRATILRAALANTCA